MQLCRLIFAIFLIIHSLSGGSSTLTKQSLMKMQGMMKTACQSKTGVKQEVLDKIKDGIFENDEKLKCYFKCCLGMMQTMKKDKIDVVGATKRVESILPDELKDVTLQQIQACKDSSGADPCDLAYQFFRCCYNHNKDNLLIPL